MGLRTSAGSRPDTERTMLLRLHVDRPKDAVVIDWLLSLHDRERHDIVRDLLYRVATGQPAAPAAMAPAAMATADTTAADTTAAMATAAMAPAAMATADTTAADSFLSFGNDQIF